MPRTAMNLMNLNQAGILNHLDRQVGRRMLVNDLQSERPAFNDAIEPLAGNGLVWLRDPNESPTGRIGNAYSIGLAAKGRRWVDTDQVNQLILNVLAQVRQRLRLNTFAARHYNQALIVEIVERELLTLHYAGDGRQTHFGTDPAYVFRNGGDYDLRPTLGALRWAAL